ncbi:DUF5988 family protein [Nonomuraea sp. NPDC005501]|uniref:DUF5988 family protein n=1 Tax=Nonomuraea sp. NPDC005501 TaxID=3156884 RepID=UPI0033B85673
MSHLAPSQPAVKQQVTAVLVGGPDHLPGDRRVQRVSAGTDTLKLPHGAGYEHFRHHGESTTVDGVDALVFQWVMHTAIAE